MAPAKWLVLESTERVQCTPREDKEQEWGKSESNGLI